MTPPDDLTAHLEAGNRRYATEGFDPSLPVRPARGLAVVSCMDSRMDVLRLLGLQPGDAHVIRNAGGLDTEDALRSLVVSQRRLGTTAVVLVHHTDCGLQGLDEEAFAAEMEEAAGERPPFTVGSFADPFEDTRQAVERLRSSPWLPRRDRISGYVYDVDSGHLLPVTDEGA